MIMPSHALRLPRGRTMELAGAALVMGILNVTPDSFYEKSRVNRDAIIDACARMVEGGADIIDVGGESSRPGASYVDAATETERVVPAVELIRGRWDIPISLDTRKAAVAEAGLKAGADIINDISALGEDPALADVAASHGVPVILMHKKGIPKTMQDRPYYEDCLREVRESLEAAAEFAQSRGISRDMIVIDPGIGFGKRLEDNIALMRGIPSLRGTGYPVLIGISRKSAIGMITGREADGRLAGSIGAACWAVSQGASILRVHDVAETVDALKVFEAFRTGKR